MKNSNVKYRLCIHHTNDSVHTRIYIILDTCKIFICNACSWTILRIYCNLRQIKWTAWLHWPARNHQHWRWASTI